MRLTEDAYAALLQQGNVREVRQAPVAGDHIGLRTPSPTHPLGLPAPAGIRPYHPYRSKTEWRYAQLLEAQKQRGVLHDWRYEPIKLRLAPATTLTVDFLVEECWDVLSRLQFHEVKSLYVREDSWVKLKTAAAMYPMFRFFRVQWKDQQWHYLEVPSA